MIKLTKEDYMLFSKERLVELLMECVEQEEKLCEEILKMGQDKPQTTIPYYPTYPYGPLTTEPVKPLEVWYGKNGTSTGDYYPPCFSKDGICTNPHHDCIDCPHPYGSGTSYSFTTNDYTSVNKDVKNFNDSVSSKDYVVSTEVSCKAK